MLRKLVSRLPQYDYLYLGDNARAPYGTRSYETVYRYTLQCVKWLLAQNCPLVILACNTASAKALRTIQQKDLEKLNPHARVLGVIRPTAEVVGDYSKTQTIGILATNGTVQSESYLIEIEKFFPGYKVVQEACPMWVPLIENGEHEGPGADFFIKKHIDSILKSAPEIDTLLLACTHYPLLKEKIQAYLPPHVTLLAQGEIVAQSLQQYLQRHPQIENGLTRQGQRNFFTTDSTIAFEQQAKLFFGEVVKANHLDL